jgi:hypothetical protein
LNALSRESRHYGAGMRARTPNRTGGICCRPLGVPRRFRDPSLVRKATVLAKD